MSLKTYWGYAGRIIARTTFALTRGTGTPDTYIQVSQNSGMTLQQQEHLEQQKTSNSLGVDLIMCGISKMGDGDVCGI